MTAGSAHGARRCLRRRLRAGEPASSRPARSARPGRTNSSSLRRPCLNSCASFALAYAAQTLRATNAACCALQCSTGAAALRRMLPRWYAGAPLAGCALPAVNAAQCMLRPHSGAPGQVTVLLRWPPTRPGQRALGSCPAPPLPALPEAAPDTALRQRVAELEAQLAGGGWEGRADAAEAERATEAARSAAAAAQQQLEGCRGAQSAARAAAALQAAEAEEARAAALEQVGRFAVSDRQAAWASCDRRGVCTHLLLRLGSAVQWRQPRRCTCSCHTAAPSPHPALRTDHARWPSARSRSA